MISISWINIAKLLVIIEKQCFHFEKHVRFSIKQPKKSFLITQCSLSTGVHVHIYTCT